MLLIMEGVMENNKLSIWHLIAGVVMFCLGGVIWFNPEDSLIALAAYLGFVFVFIGVGYLLAFASFRTGWYLWVGILDIFVGFVLLSNIGGTAAMLPVIFALWCLSIGVVQIFAAWELKKINWPWKWSVMAGMLGVLFGMLLLAYPLFSAAFIVALMGMYSIAYGLVEILEYLYARKLYA